MIATSEFEDLARVIDRPCVSLYLPTHTAGSQTRQDPIRLKNLVTKARDIGEHSNAEWRDAVTAALKPVDALIDDTEFWRHQERGLALFASPDRELEIHKLPYDVEEFVYVDTHFCMRPLLPAVHDGRAFHLLALSRNDVRLFECTRDAITEIPRGPVPKSLVDALGSDQEESTLQHHTASANRVAGRPDAVFHGHGRGKDDDEIDLERFLRAVDDGLSERFRDTPARPLVVAAVREERAAFADLSKQPRLFEAGVDGNPEHVDEKTLHRRALDVALPALDAEHDRLLARAREAAGSDHALDDVDRIVDAARQGRVASLFVRCDEPVWGVSPDEESTRSDRIDLLDLAVRHAHATGAHVAPVNGHDDFPTKSPALAVLRY